VAYLNAMIGDKSLQEYVYDKIPENKKQDYDSSILMIYNYKKFENGSKVFYGEVCKTCTNSNIELREVVCFWKDDLILPFEGNDIKFEHVLCKHAYRKVDQLKFELIRKSNSLLQIINDVIEIDIDYICKQLLIHNPPNNYFEKYVLVINKITSSLYPSPNYLYIFNIIKQIYIKLKLKEKGMYDIQQELLDNLLQAEREWDNLSKNDKNFKSFNKRLIELGIKGESFKKYVKLKGTYSGNFNKKMAILLC